jgi:hypothetical protein
MMAAKSGAERQKKYREDMIKQGYKQLVIWVDANGNRVGAKHIGEPNKTQQGQDEQEKVKFAGRAREWEEELHAERLKEARAEGRKLARNQDKTYWNGKVFGICQAAEFFIYKQRPDIAKALLDYYEIDREKAEAALQADKRVKSMTLTTLDKHGVWEYSEVRDIS